MSSNISEAISYMNLYFSLKESPMQGRIISSHIKSEIGIPSRISGPQDPVDGRTFAIKGRISVVGELMDND
jgi:hypothetical protein